jgi:hypothetical protein
MVPRQNDAPTLIRGSKIICPNCETAGTLEGDFKVLDRNEKYAMELNVIYQHRKDKGHCGHIFSLGDQRIIAAVLRGDLVPRNLLDDALSRLADLGHHKNNNGRQVEQSVQPLRQGG